MGMSVFKIFLTITLFLSTFMGFGQQTAILRTLDFSKIADQDLNYRDKYQEYRQIALDEKTSSEQCAQAYLKAVANMSLAGLIDEFDDFTETLIALRPNSVAVMSAVGRILTSEALPHQGRTIGQSFTRGYSRGKNIYSAKRDRIVALKVLANVIPEANKISKSCQAEFYLTLADALMFRHNGRYSWQLQKLSNLELLPDYEEILFDAPNDAPVDSSGYPVLYRAPKSFKTATNDGERWRFALHQAEKLGLVVEVKMRWAEFLDQQFGVQTLGYSSKREELPSLRDDEAYARLANGSQRFQLPDEFNPLKIYRSLLGTPRPEPYLALSAIYSRRLQYVAAATVLKQWLNEHGDAASPQITKLYTEITSNKAEFETAGVFTDQHKLVATLKYKNTQNIDLVIRQFDVDKFFNSAEVTLKNQELLGKIHDFTEVLSLLPLKEQEALLGPTIEQWLVKLQPGSDHLQQKATLPLPNLKPGVYLLTGHVRDVKEFSQIICISKSALTVYTIGNRTICSIADANNGQPLSEHTIEFFGWKEPRNVKSVKREIDQFKATTDKDGIIFLEQGKLKKDYSYVIRLRENKNPASFAIILNHRSYINHSYPHKRVQAFGVSDCPVYKPGDKVNFQFWVRDTTNDNENVLNYAEHEAEITVITGRGAELFKKSFTTNKNAALSGDFELPDNVELGTMRILLNLKSKKSADRVFGTINATIEEYRIPEYEVNIQTTPNTVVLGDKFSAKISAKYYFGAPVTKALVNYKVIRNAEIQLLLRPDKWGWLYGKTMIFPPIRQPDELVMNGIAELDHDGTFTIEIDTASGKSLSEGQNQEYKISAEVVDASQRSISASTSVIATATPYHASIELSHGYAAVGTDLTADILISDAKGNPTPCAASIGLYRVEKDTEKILNVWENLKIDATGTLKHNFKVETAGVYRLKATCNIASGYSCNATVDTIIIGTESAIDYGFKKLDITPERELYKPGDTAKLLISSNIKDAKVFWVSRSNDPNAMPEVLTLENGFIIREITITEDDTPNIFSYVAMIHDGKLSTAACQIKIPPFDKTLKVTIIADKKEYSPGTDAKLKINITASDGQPVQGKLAITVYDKALEYISTTAIPDIRQAFWGWRRQPNFPYYQFSMNYKFPSSGQLLSLYNYPQGISLGGTATSPKMATSLNATMAFSAETTQTDHTQIRSDFRTGAYWNGAVETDENGSAEVSFTLPDSVTTWQAIAWVIDSKCATGQGKTEFIVKKDLLARLIMPRFLITGDTATISGLIHNYTSSTQTTEINLTSDSKSLDIEEKRHKDNIPQNGQAQAEWQIEALATANPGLTLFAKTADCSDAVKIKLPILTYGIQQWFNVSGKIEPDNSDSLFIPLNLPHNVSSKTVKLKIDYTTSPASAMIDILPYLLDEKKIDIFSVANRFSALVAAKELLKPAGSPTNLIKKVEIPAGFEQIYDQKAFNKTVCAAGKQLKAMQNNDGGWGWFSGYYETSRAETTAYAVHALNLAKNSGLSFDENMQKEGLEWLKAYRATHCKKPDQVNDLAVLVNQALTEAGMPDSEVFNLLYEHRSKLSLQALAILAQSTSDSEEQKMLLRNLEQFLYKNPRTQTAYLKLPEDSSWWNWWNDELAANAAYLKLLSSVEVKNPHAAMVAKYIIENRKHAALESAARQNAQCVEAMSAYLKNSKELQQKAEIEIKFDGKSITKQTIEPTHLGLPSQSLLVNPELVVNSKHTVEIRRCTGTAPVYFAVNLSYFNQAKPLPTAGEKLTIKRAAYLLTHSPIKQPVSAQEEVKTESWQRTPFSHKTPLKLGDLIEIELTIESANDYDYIMVQDHKAAGFEPLEIGSGYRPDFFGAYVELQNSTTNFYLQRLKRGTTILRYRLKAETKGVFTALPAIAASTQVPELQGNSTALEFTITD